MKSKKLISCILTLIMIVSVIFAFQSVAFGAEVVVETYDDFVAAVNSKAKTIVVNGTLMATQTVELKTDTVIKSTTGGAIMGDGTFALIVGNGNDITVEGMTLSFGSTVVSTSKNGSLTLIDSTFSDCTDSAVYCDQGKLTATNCTFTNNIGQNGNGGAILYSGKKETIDLTNCTFNNNISFNNGGAICAYEAPGTILNGCSFRGNSSVNSGGAIFAGKSVTAVDTVFDSNAISTYNGGAIYMWEGTLDLTNCSFIGNTALGTDGTGGAILADTSSSVIVKGGEFKNNQSTVWGGAICGTTMTIVDLDGTVFEGNTSTLGGGIYSWTGVNAKNVKFTNNQASGDGGGIYAAGLHQVYDSEFTNNTAGYKGGAIWGLTSDMGYYNCNFTGNSNTNEEGVGGIIYMENCDVWMTDCNFTDNSSVNGGIYNLAGAIHIYGGTSSGNTTNGSGSVAFAQAGELTAENATFTGNHAVISGVLAASAGNIKVVNCTFNENTSAGSGAAIVSLGSTQKCTISVDGSTFTGNTADISGGAIMGNMGTLTVSGCSFVNNSAVSKNGGALFFLNGTVEVNASTFEGNNAAEKGSAIAVTQGSVVFGEDCSTKGGTVPTGEAVAAPKTEGEITVIEAPSTEVPSTDAPDEEPTDTPADEPADEPTDEPADEPADEPTDAPAEEKGGNAGLIIGIVVAVIAVIGVAVVVVLKKKKK